MVKAGSIVDALAVRKKRGCSAVIASFSFMSKHSTDSCMWQKTRSFPFEYFKQHILRGRKQRTLCMRVEGAFQALQHWEDGIYPVKGHDGIN